MIIEPTVATYHEPETIPFTDLELIGTAGGRQYARVSDGRELLLGSVMQPWEADNPPRRAEVRIRRPEVFKDRSMAFPERVTTTIRATVVPVGSYERAVEANKAKPISQPFLPVDALAAVSALAAKPERYMPGVAPSNPLLTGSGLKLDGSPAVRGPRAILDFLEGKGIRLTPTADGLSVIVRSRAGRLMPPVREAIRATARLLAGELTGNPVACELCRGKNRAPAVTILEVDVAACGRCASEELEP